MTTRPSPRRVRNVAVLLVASCVASLLTLSASGTTRAVPPAANPWDVSSAIRYNASGTVIGSVPQSLVGQDERGHLVTSAFPLNVFGTRSSELCIEVNGLIRFAGLNCPGQRDQSLGALAVQARSSALAPLGADIDLRPDVGTELTGAPHLMYLTITNASRNGVTTVETNVAHGLAPGHQVVFDATVAPVVGVPSATSFTINNLGFGAIPRIGASVRRSITTFGSISSIVGDGTTVTVQTSGIHYLGTGDYITFRDTGIVAIDNRHFEVTRVNSTTVTFAQPAGFDASTATALTVGNKWLMSDGYGALGQIYYGTATVDGREAMVVTWYRVSMRSAANPKTRYVTFQLVLVKKATGSDAAGWDFDVEFNYGTVNDDEDGYLAPSYDANDGLTEGLPAGGWQADGANPYGGAPRAESRWAIGAASYREITNSLNYQVENCATKCLATINTATAHGLKPGDLVKVQSLGASFTGYFGRTVTGTEGTTMKLIFPGNTTSFSNVALTSTFGLTELRVSDDYELFPTTGVADLVDQSTGTTKRLTANSKNSATLGRYAFQMVGGKVIMVDPALLPGVPRTMTAYYGRNPTDTTRATVTFAAPLTDGGSAITTYTVRTTPAAGSGDCVLTMPAPLTCTFTGLTPGTTYTAAAFATNVNGNGDASTATVSVYVPDPSAMPSAPLALTAYYQHYPLDPSRATVSFAAPSSDGGNAITSYTVRTVPAVAGGDCVLTMPAPLTCTFSGLAGNRTYRAEVFATNSEGDGPVSSSVIGWYSEDVPDVPRPRTVPGSGPFRLDDSAPLVVAPGKSAMYVDGEAIDLTAALAKLANGTRVVKLSAAGGSFEMSIGGDCPTCSVSKNDTGDFVLGVAQSAPVRVRGYGFKPGSKVNVFLSPGERLIGFFTSDRDGGFNGSFRVPAAVPRGPATVQVSGSTTDDVVRAVAVGISVDRTPPKECTRKREKGKPRTVCPT